MHYTLGRTPVMDTKYVVGIAYVAIPTDVDRQEYIRDCYRNHTVSVWGEDGSFMNRLPVPPEILNFIEFPEEVAELGSPVVYVTEETQSLPIIIARFPQSNALGDLKEWGFKWSRTCNDASVEIFGSPKSNLLSFNVNAGAGSGNLLLNVTGEQHGKLSTIVQGDMECQTSENVNFEQQAMFRTATYERNAEEGEEDNHAVFEQYPGSNNFTNKKFVINNGSEPMVLGKKLKAFMSDFIDEISKATVTTAIGQQPLLNAAQITAFKNRTDEFLSIVGYINE